MKELQHLSMFYPADNDNGFIQCVVKPQYRDEFQALGFVDHVDRLKPVEKKPKKKNKHANSTLDLMGVSDD